MLEYKLLKSCDLSSLKHIDRSDQAEEWYLVQDGKLIREKRSFNHPGFSLPQWQEIIQEFRNQLLKHNLILYGALESGKLVGAGGLDISQSCGPENNLFNLGPLWVTASQRGQGIGSQLFDLLKNHAKKHPVAGLYISATPVPSTVDFYLHQGCRLLSKPDPSLMEKEPEDIHLALYFSSPGIEAI